MKQLTKQRIKAPLKAILPMITVYVMEIILGTALYAVLYATGKGSAENSYAKLAVHETAMLCGAAAACALVKKDSGVRLREVIRIKSFDFTVPLLLMLFTWSAGELSDHMCGLVLSSFMTVEPNTSLLAGFSDIISAVVFAPLFEEIIFRFGGCEIPRGKFNVPLICVANGVYFSIVHGYNIQGFFNVFIAGVCAAYIYIKTRNILYVMLEHAAHNALCIIEFEKISLFGEPLYYNKNGFILGAWYWIVFNAVIFILCIIWYIKKFRPKYRHNYFEKKAEAGVSDTN